MRRRRAAVGLAAAALAVAGALVISIQPAAVDMCVTVYEDASGGGDSWTTCAFPANLKVPNLGTHTNGLHNGCNRSINQSSSWSDCISSVKVEAMPGNQRVRLYQDTNYGTWVWCQDANGTSGPTNVGSANDLASSYRVEGGNC